MPAVAHPTDPSKVNTFTPSTMARSQSLFCKLRRALCKATNDDEHAVSMAELGPCSPKTYDIRPADTDNALEVTSYTEENDNDDDDDDDDDDDGPPGENELELPMLPEIPTNTPVLLPRSSSIATPASIKLS